MPSPLALASTSAGVLEAGLTRPPLVAGLRMLAGALFGIASGMLAKALIEPPAAAPAH